MSSPRDEIEARLVLLALPRLGPRRARWLTEATSAAEVVAALRQRHLLAARAEAPTGVSQALVEEWFAWVRRLDGAAMAEQHEAAGIRVIGPEDEHWPLVEEPDPPLLLFGLGRLETLAGPPPLRVAVVGTRRCSTIGRRVAARLGDELTQRGIAVVSGLALGIDGAAHLGALRKRDVVAPAPGVPIAIVATGLDRIYPPGNRALWEEMAERGVLLSEAPLGTPPERWRFPARNRLIAGLSDLVVVVESHERGGALLTVEEAADRGVGVAAVPGSVLSAASRGTNALLVDGCPPIRGTADVLALLGSPTSASAETRLPVELDELGTTILEQVAAGELHLDDLVAITGGKVTDVIAAVARLEKVGLVQCRGHLVALSDCRAPR